MAVNNSPTDISPSLDKLGQAFLQPRSKEYRLAHGQFYTPACLCDWMLSWALRTGHETVLDPGCGIGAFLIRGQALKSFLRTNHAPDMYGLDIDPEAVHVARTLASTKQTTFEVCDFLEKLPDGWPPMFDVVVGNPPYVRSEVAGRSSGKQAAPPRSQDLYVRFIHRATELLKPGGRLVMIISNSWLHTGFGRAFLAYLSQNFHIQLLVESRVERWFPDAATNPVIIALVKKSRLEEVSPPTRRVFLKKPLTEWLSEPSESNYQNYWPALQTRWTELETLPPGNYTDSEIHEERFTLAPATALEKAMQCGDRLGKAIAAFDDWQTLSEWGRVRYPIKTGINRFFYLSATEAETWGIEPRFLVPLVKSSRAITTWQLQSHQHSHWMFSCMLSKQELHDQGYSGALAYIEWGENQQSPPRQKRSKPTPWPEIASVQGRPYWYAIPAIPPADILCNRFFDNRFFFPLITGNIVEDQTFYGLQVPSENSNKRLLLAALLNTSLSFWLVETGGQCNLGEGVLQYSRKDMANLPVVNPDVFSPSQQAAIIEAFSAICQRPILPLETELQQPDRVALDKVVLSIFKSDVDTLASNIRERLLERVNQRRTRAKTMISLQ